MMENGTRLYCQSCDESFIDLPCNPFPQGCAKCGGREWATYKRQAAPSMVVTFPLTPPAAAPITGYWINYRS